MAEETNRGGGVGPLYFIVGGLVVAVGIGAFILYGGNMPDGPATTSTTTTEQTTTQPTTDGGTSTTTTTQETQQ